MTDEDLIERSAAAVAKAEKQVADESTALRGTMSDFVSGSARRTLGYSRLLDSKLELSLVKRRHERMTKRATAELAMKRF